MKKNINHINFMNDINWVKIQQINKTYVSTQVYYYYYYLKFLYLFILQAKIVKRFDVLLNLASL